MKSAAAGDRGGELPLGFDEAREENSRWASRDWSRYRQGVRQLLRRFAKGGAGERVRLALAEDVLDCATHWGMDGAVVERALADLLRLNPPAGALAFGSGQYAFWVSRVAAAAKREHASELLTQAEQQIRQCPDFTRRNLTIMLSKARQALIDLEAKD
ncbi:MAG: hypothetical protein Q8N23_28800 [Archangium sp.]|nr:hypothetical protein [Archangium sp.]